MQSFTQKAKCLAIMYHDGQVYAHPKPYTDHLSEVCRIVKEELLVDAEHHTPYIFDDKIGGDLDVLGAISWGHDLLEDTTITAPQLGILLSPEIAFGIWTISDPEGRNRVTRKAKLTKKVSDVKAQAQDDKDVLRLFTFAVLVKYADRIMNIRQNLLEQDVSRARVYWGERKQFRRDFHDGTARAFFPRLLTHVENVLYQEYTRLEKLV
jgi:(p)ppGpp synthase/HD superfamily hydrolase